MILDPWFWLFVAVVPIVFRVLPDAIKYWFVAAASLAYVATLSPTSATIAIVAALAAYVMAGAAAKKPERRKLIVTVAIVALLAVLGFWKYTPAIAKSLSQGSWFAKIAYPIGLSFYIFRLIHYVIEAGRGKIEDRSVGTFLAYVMLVPIFTAGPIEQYDHFLKNSSPRASAADALIGLGRIAQGMIKKLLLAELLVRDTLMWRPGIPAFIRHLPDETVPSIWLFLFLFFLWGYLDFSSYSDIAIGVCRLLGIKVAENFNWPFLAHNIGNFWKRWHITLAAWTQRYVYMPVIARTRRPYVAVYATFLAMGLWHAADLSYLGWGLYHATGVSVALTFARFKRMRKIAPAPSILKHWGVPVTLVFVCGSSIFSSTSGHGTKALFKLLAYATGLR